MPGISPWLAISRKQSRDNLNLRKNPRDRPVNWHLLRRRVLEEVMGSCSVTSAIKEICSDGEIEYELQSTDYGEVERYHCFYCGYIIKDKNDELITTNTELGEWVKNNCSQE